MKARILYKSWKGKWALEEIGGNNLFPLYYANTKKELIELYSMNYQTIYVYKKDAHLEKIIQN